MTFQAKQRSAGRSTGGGACRVELRAAEPGAFRRPAPSLQVSHMPSPSRGAHCTLGGSEATATHHAAEVPSGPADNETGHCRRDLQILSRATATSHSHQDFVWSLPSGQSETPPHVDRHHHHREEQPGQGRPYRARDPLRPDPAGRGPSDHAARTRGGEPGVEALDAGAAAP